MAITVSRKVSADGDSSIAYKTSLAYGDYSMSGFVKGRSRDIQRMTFGYNVKLHG